MFEEAMPASTGETAQASMTEQKPRKKKKKKKLKGKARIRAMTREERFEKARKWLPAFDGADILKAYRKKYALDRMTALAEMQMLGYTFTEEQIAAEKKAVQAYAQLQRAKKLKRRAKRRAAKLEKEYRRTDQNDTFYFIAGYTSGGAPYGVTWEQMGLPPYGEPE